MNIYLVILGSVTIDEGTANEEIAALDANNFVLRGSSLKNTDYIFAVVCYNGSNCKFMLNSTPARNKESDL